MVNADEYKEEINLWDKTQMFLHDWIEIVGHSSSWQTIVEIVGVFELQKSENQSLQITYFN